MAFTKIVGKTEYWFCGKQYSYQVGFKQINCTGNAKNLTFMIPYILLYAS